MEKQGMEITVGLDGNGALDIQLYVQGYDAVQFTSYDIYQVVNVVRLMKSTYKITIHFSPILSTTNQQLYQYVKDVLGRG